MAALNFRQMNDWWDFYRQRPFGEQAQDHRYTHQNLLLTAHQRRKDDPVDVDRYRPFASPKKSEPADASAMMEILKGVNAR
mgnify:CR=1 FL=1